MASPNYAVKYSAAVHLLLLSAVPAALGTAIADTLVLYLYSNTDEHRANLVYFVDTAISGDVNRTELYVLVVNQYSKVW